MNSPVERFPLLHIHRVMLLGFGFLLLAAWGCSREHYRNQADCEVYSLIDCASTDLRWPLDDFSIQPDPLSRFYDPSNPDCPPMPPDDPSSHHYMQCVDGKRGWAHWHDRGDTPSVENPAWMAYLPFDENGQVVLDRDAAVQMALLHSREYQRAMEDLYLLALDVSLERFRFDAQFFGGNSNFYTADGRLRGGGNSRSTLATNTDLQMHRLFAPGGELVVGVANSLVWQFAGPDTYSANTLLDFSLVQPLLRAGGRSVVLESLTSSERALLAEIRGLERFNREFYVQTVAGGGFRAGAFLGLLRDQVQIQNQVSNVAAFQDSLDRLEAGYEAGQKSLQEVEAARQSLFSNQSALLSQKSSYETSLDSYKIALGLPPDLPVRIEDPLVDRFNLIDPSVTAAQTIVANLLKPLRDPDQAMPADYGTRLASVRQQSETLLEMVAHDLELLIAALPDRRESLGILSAREEFQRGEADPVLVDVNALHRRVVERNADFYGNEAPVVQQLVGQLLTTPEDLQWFEDFKQMKKQLQEEDLRGLADNLRATLAEIDAFEQDPAAVTADFNAALEAEEESKTPKQVLAFLTNDLSGQLLELSLVQAQARLDAVTLVPIELGPPEAFQTAGDNRRDWMNARADLVDAWRQIEIRANALKSNVNVTFNGDISTTDNNPAQFRAPTGRLRVGLEFDAPLTRVTERNAYRRALITYQRARRTYYAFEDGIDQSLRNLLRQIRLSQLDFEITRGSVFIAITRVDQGRLRLEEPPSAGGGGGSRGTDATRELIDSLRALLASQNQFLGAWVDYEVLRMKLDLDLGIMKLDDRGMWIDPGPVEPGNAEGQEELSLPQDGVLHEIQLLPPTVDTAESIPSDPDGFAPPGLISVAQASFPVIPTRESSCPPFLNHFFVGPPRQFSQVDRSGVEPPSGVDWPVYRRLPTPKPPAWEGTQASLDEVVDPYPATARTRPATAIQ
jgi:outer membrane protein TolC